ncbi:MAG: MBOAT family protein, partial [Lachnospiraceae bacterium]|nr:MBOAT family protein [Lachnospiraceae bacterium]
MVFSSLVFLCAFLPVVLALYIICPKKYKNFWLMISSLFFYAWGEPKYIFIMIFSTVFDYANGRLLEYFDEQKFEKEKQDKFRKIVLAVSVVGNLGILFVFKYFDLLLSSWNQLTGSNIGLFHLALPIGISFYTFQTMSYTIDVYRRTVKAQHDFISFAMYVSMFPQLIAGPIVRYKWVEKQMVGRSVTVEAWTAGMQRFLIGLAKKVLLANQVGFLWDDIAASTPNELSIAGAWLGAFAYTFQIYFDFSGYSDMAIGLGKMFGFSFAENLMHPYESKSITEFWRRWHISLSGWFKDYVYITLGGNRKGRARQILNMFIVWFLTGFWHGASWNFVLWGLYYFAILLVEKLVLRKEMECWPDFLRHVYTKFIIVTGWMLFANENFGKMGIYLKTMFGIRGDFLNDTAIYQWRTHFFFFVILFLASTTLPQRLWKKFKERIWGDRD